MKKIKQFALRFLKSIYLIIALIAICAGASTFFLSLIVGGIISIPFYWFTGKGLIKTVEDKLKGK